MCMRQMRPPGRGGRCSILPMNRAASALSEGQNLTGSFDAECRHGRSCKAFGSITAGQEEISAASDQLQVSCAAPRGMSPLP